MKFFTASLFTAAAAAVTNGNCGTGCSGATPVCAVTAKFVAQPSVTEKCKNTANDADCPTLATQTGTDAEKKAKLAVACKAKAYCHLAADGNSCPAPTTACKCVAAASTKKDKDSSTKKKDKDSSTKKKDKDSSATRNLALAGLALVGLVTV